MTGPSLRETAISGKAPDYRDSSGRALSDYDQPSVAVDVALLTIGETTADQPQLLLLQWARREGGHRPNEWSLPGAFIHRGERAADAVRRTLHDKVGLSDVIPVQLAVFDDPKRDDRGWVMSIAHVAVVPLERIASAVAAREDLRLVPASSPGRMPYDHAAIVERAVERTREDYAREPDPWRLLPDEFTLRDLRVVHEAIAGESLHPDAFRRFMADKELVVPTGGVSRGRGRPARLFMRGARTANRVSAPRLRG